MKSRNRVSLEVCQKKLGNGDEKDIIQEQMIMKGKWRLLINSMEILEKQILDQKIKKKFKTITIQNSKHFWASYELTA